ncbi:MAG: 50S ribosomal protein L21 [Patescibacteria group bacterium]
MKFAVIATGGKQYVVAPGDTLKIEKLEKNAGDKVVFDQVLLADDGSATKLGTPTVSGMSVEGEVVKQGRHDKVISVRYKAKARQQTKHGHRQPYSEVKITKIA